MCSGGCAKCLGTTLIPLAVLCTLANILLFFPGGEVINNNSHITNEVWYFGGMLGSGVLMIFPALVFLGLKNNDCCGCCGNESCGKRFATVLHIHLSRIHLIVVRGQK
uniref:Transmembrane 4 L six family member 4 n=1 Tax=Chelonoidis abingdonii TaxID=106734 RepID=A0A8C0J4R9_CHEAB